MKCRARETRIITECLVWSGENQREMFDFLTLGKCKEQAMDSFGTHFRIDFTENPDSGLVIKRHGGGVTKATPGCYIVKSDLGFRVMVKSYFDKEFEIVEREEQETREPKMFFDNEQEMYDCLNYWKKKLLLSDWHIAIAFAKRGELSDINWAGESECQWVNRCGTISILEKDSMPNDMIIKQPHEVTLIHELLHFKFFSAENHSLEGVYYTEMQHQLLEDMAKSLFMAKYNLDFDWWVEDTAKA